MDKKTMQERIQMITSEMAQTKANYAKLEGHLAEANHWLMEEIKKETEAQVQADKESLNGEVNQQAEEQSSCERLCAAEG